MKEKKNNNKKIVVIIVLVLIVVGGFIGYLYSMKVATIEYNKAVDNYRETAKSYNVAVSEVNVQYVDGMLEKIEFISNVDTEMKAVFKSFINFNTRGKIVKDTEAIREQEESIKSMMDILEQINNPNAKWVIDRITTIEGITDVQSVTLSDNPDGLLHKADGGYKGCIYFGLDTIDASEIPGDNIVDKGTDAGGAIEIYENLEDAKTRCEYLSEFDGTILESGTYTIVGTMVVRTSYKLSSDEAIEVTDSIINCLTTHE